MSVRTIAAVAIAVASFGAHAESWFQFEAGAGFAKYEDRGDGTWQQWGAPGNTTNMKAPILTAGITGPIITRGKWGVDWHADYQFIGTSSASCMCTITDENYDNRAHKIVENIPNMPLEQYNGHGHTQGLSLMVEPYYMVRGFRVGVLAGLFLNVPTWHETVTQVPGTQFQSVAVASRHTINLGQTVGVSVSRGNFSVRYQYFKLPYYGNPFPPIFKGAHTVSLIYKF